MRPRQWSMRSSPPAGRCADERTADQCGCWKPVARPSPNPASDMCRWPATGEDRRRLRNRGRRHFISQQQAGDRAAARRMTMTLKVRCGGTMPDAFPTAEELTSCDRRRQMGVPLKFTAGLHHHSRVTTRQSPRNAASSTSSQPSYSPRSTSGPAWVAACLRDDDPRTSNSRMTR